MFYYFTHHDHHHRDHHQRLYHQQHHHYNNTLWFMFLYWQLVCKLITKKRPMTVSENFIFFGYKCTYIFHKIKFFFVHYTAQNYNYGIWFLYSVPGCSTESTHIFGFKYMGGKEKGGKQKTSISLHTNRWCLPMGIREYDWTFITYFGSGRNLAIAIVKVEITWLACVCPH